MDNLNSNLLGNVKILSRLRRRLLSELMSATGLESLTERFCNCFAAWRKDLFYFLWFSAFYECIW